MGVRDKLRYPPSIVSGELGDYLLDIYKVVNGTPTLSWFSGQTPNSTLTGIAGDIAVNIGSASTTTRAWIKTGSTAVPDTQNWVTLATGPT